MHPDTIARGVREAQGQPEPRVRAPGGGRKKLAETDPALAAELRKLVDPETRGDPMSPLVWTTKSTRHLAGALTVAGNGVSDRTVARMLAAMGFSLQGSAKVAQGRQHVGRDAQFGYLNDQVTAHLVAGQPEFNQLCQDEITIGANCRRSYSTTGTLPVWSAKPRWLLVRCGGQPPEAMNITIEYALRADRFGQCRTGGKPH